MPRSALPGIDVNGQRGRAGPGAQARASAAEHLVDVLVALHALDGHAARLATSAASREAGAAGARVVLAEAARDALRAGSL